MSPKAIVLLGLIAVMALVSIGTARASSHQPFSNGSFETALSTSDWTVTAGSIDRLSGWTASAGSWSLDLNGSTPGTISQTFDTVVGQDYEVLFDMAGNSYTPDLKRLEVSAAGQSAVHSFDNTGKSNTNMGWLEKSFLFTASASATDLVFKSLNNTGDLRVGPALDNVRVNVVVGSATVSINDDSVIEGGNLNFTVSLSNSLSEDAVVTYSTADGTATTANSDYTGQTNQTLTIPAGLTSGTITVATTDDTDVEPDETLNVNLTGVLATNSAVASGPIFWTDWTGTFSGGAGQGTITTGTSTVGVTYSNPQGISFYQPAGGIDYYANNFFGTSRDPATSPFTSVVVQNIPTGTDIVGLQYAGSQTLTFSEIIANPVFSYVSLNGNGYGFDQDFEILSFGDPSDGNDCGYWGCGTSYKNVVDLGGGAFEYQLLGTGEPHGTIRFLGAFDTLTWRSLSNETWNGFTVGVQGTAAEVSLNVSVLDGSGLGTILNDDQDAPELAVSGVVEFSAGGSPVIVGPGLTLTSSDPIAQAKVLIGTGFNPAEDTLGVAGVLPAGLTAAYNSATGVLTISGSGSAADYQATLRQVTYSNSSGSPDATDREITFSIGAGLAFSDNGHFYEFVPVVNLNWNTAKSEAEGKTLFGLQGYLATITSGGENAFVFDRLQGNGWLGGSDFGSEGNWSWVSGPETGTLFCVGQYTCVPQGGAYTNWDANEPNNAGPEHYAHMIGNTALNESTWNDLPVTGGNGAYAVQGYVVEYGGSAGDPVLQLSGTVTVKILVPPSVDADNASVTVDEGSPAANSGTFSDANGDTVAVSTSVGTLTQTGTSSGTWAWSFNTNDGPAESQLVTITANDGNGGVSQTTFDLIVQNVPPVASITGAAINEGGTAEVTGTFSDVVSLDTHTVTIFWGDGTNDALGTVTSPVNASHAYGDNGNYEVTIKVTDNDLGSVESSATIVVDNLDPTVAIDATGVVTLLGQDYFTGKVGIAQSHSATAGDAGSDDLIFDWSFAPDAAVVSNTHYNDGTGPDPADSPDGTYPFDATDTASVTFALPGIYTVAVTASDDDGGSNSDSIKKLVLDDCDCAKSQGFWKKQFRGKGKDDQIDESILGLYLNIINDASGIFDESIALSGIADANRILNPEKGNNGNGGTGNGNNETTKGSQTGTNRKKDKGGSKKGTSPDSGDDSASDEGSIAKSKEKALSQTLAAWLNFAKGAIAVDEMIDTDGDGIGDTAFGDLIAQVESILSNPDATKADLELAKDLAESVNQHDKDNPDCETGTGSGNATGKGSSKGTK
ncbi:MAG: choice-of-anchor C family protein [Chloroflexi bacterium]|nr:choice-of-anchor C family protein [Chloroflexota bacterium]MDA1272277.1 choice-of-anchor C family protein [Chloroflexota bacterium]